MVISRLVPLLLALTLSPSAVSAQDTAPPISPVTFQEVTLAAALAAVKPPEGQTVLAVAAERTRLPQRASPPEAGASLGDVAQTFGQVAQDFGDVTAVATPAMTLLNTAPGTPDIYADLSPGDALKLLAATLSPAQWRLLIGPQGIGQDDLTTDAQHSLFMAQFPGGVLKVEPQHSPLALQTNRHEEVRDLTGDLPHTCLRLRREVLLTLPSLQNPGSAFMIFEPDTPGTPHYGLARQWQPRDTLYGVPLHQEVPNTPKESQLDYDRSALRKAVSLDGIKTVGDLVARIGFACRIEIYADRRYEGRRITTVGTRSAPARRLLQALAFCLTGTFRRIGPAFVLTDDVLGAGTRREILSEFERAEGILRRRPLDAAGDALTAAHSPDDLPTDADPLALSPAQLSDARRQGWTGAQMTIMLPFSALTPRQQQAARRKFTQFRESRDPSQESSTGDMPTLDGKIWLESSPKLELIVPSLAEPVTLASSSLSEMFRPSPEMPELGRPPQAANPSIAPLLSGLLKTIPHRAVLVRSRTPAEVDATVASMKAIGLNELWLDVFSDGICRIPVTDGGTALKGVTPLPPDAGDILAEAIRVTRGSGIRVFPALSLLVWGGRAPAEMQDRMILGETAAEADAGRPSEGSSGPRRILPARFTVSPFAPSVQTALRSLVQSLAARPGLAGIVWRETAPPGYEDEGSGQSPEEFGYTETVRLAFLRRAHVDPFDIPLQNGNQADTRLPEFDDGAEEAALSKEWEKFRSVGDVTLLRGLANVWAAGGTRRPILIRQRREGWSDGWFGSWDGPDRPLPAHHSPWIQRTAGPAYPEAADLQAKMTSQTALRRLSSWAASSQSAFLGELDQSVKGKHWDGFVLDLTPDARMGNAPATVGENPLARLVPRPAKAAK